MRRKLLFARGGMGAAETAVQGCRVEIDSGETGGKPADVHQRGVFWVKE